MYKVKKDAAVKSNNYIYYGEEVIAKLELIKEVKAIGFTIAEIKEIIDASYNKQLTVENRKQILLLKSKKLREELRI